MRVRRLLALAAILWAVGAGDPVAAQGPSWTDWGSITSLEAGWADDTLTIRNNVPMVNSFVSTPAGARACSVTTAGYATDPSDPGRNLYYSLAMAALMNKRDVRLLIRGCVFNKPRLIAIEVR